MINYGIKIVNKRLVPKSNNITDVVGIPPTSSQHLLHTSRKKSSTSVCNFSPEDFFMNPAKQATSAKEFSLLRAAFNQ